MITMGRMLKALFFYFILLKGFMKMRAHFFTHHLRRVGVRLAFSKNIAPRDFTLC
jgi:hypothetical protein